MRAAFVCLALLVCALRFTPSAANGRANLIGDVAVEAAIFEALEKGDQIEEPIAEWDGTRDGRTLFVAGADGGVDAVDLRSPSPSSLALARPGGPPPSSLAHDDPWLALATGSGGVTLLDARAPRRAPRRLGAGLAGRPACARSVDIQGRWVAAAFDDSAGVRVWRFGREEEEQRGRGA